jgi:predicted Co/Zn/Cd cation transporter (cation efflux family)
VKNPKTTIAGWLTFAVALLSAAQAVLDGDPTTTPDWAIVLGALTTALGLMFSKDSTPKP